MTFTENRQRVTDPSGPLFLLEISADSFSGPAYLASDNRDWVSNGRTYIGTGFGFRLPDDVADTAPMLRLTLANVGRGWSEELERLGPNDIVKATFLITDKGNPDQIERRIPVRLSGASLTGGEVTAQGGMDAMLRQQAVRLRQTPSVTPGLF